MAGTIAVHIADEVPIALDDIGLKISQQFQTRLPRTKVVNRRFETTAFVQMMRSIGKLWASAAATAVRRQTFGLQMAWGR